MEVGEKQDVQSRRVQSGNLVLHRGLFGAADDAGACVD
jgi:hypothetical protein